MSYSRNFGMRSFENIVRDGRFRAPKTGTPFKIGSPVQLDPDNPGLLRQAPAGAAPGQNCGLVIFEHIQNKSDQLTTVHDSPYDQVPLGQYAQMAHGQGSKYWFMNTDDKVLYDGRVQAAGGILADGLDVSTLKPGDGLVVVADGRLDKGAAADAWLIVEQANPSTGRVEARLTF